jgi:hypothetical protein
MSSICNVKGPEQLSPREGLQEATGRDVYGLVDGPIATGSAHLMRAGSEIHLLHADLELGDLRQAAVRVSCAEAAVKAALEEYETSHKIAQELDFYSIHNERIREARAGSFRIPEVLHEATARGLVSLDDSSLSTITHAFDQNGDEQAFSEFITELKEFSTTLAQFDPASANEDTVQWQQFAWKSITLFNHVRTHGQALAIINTFGLTKKPAATTVAS